MILSLKIGCYALLTFKLKCVLKSGKLSLNSSFIKIKYLKEIFINAKNGYVS